MSDLFVMPSADKYGIEAWKNLIAAANSLYDLVDAIYLDDYDFKSDDLIDLVGRGPETATRIIAAAKTANQLDDEAGDFTESEKTELVTLAGERFQKPAYAKILRGVADIADGVSELINPANPTD